MADTITTTHELNIQLLNDAGTASRILKVSNPNTTTFVTRATVERTLAPLFAYASSETTVATIPFFYDDGNQGGYDEPMTKIGDIEVVITQKVVHPIT